MEKLVQALVNGIIFGAPYSLLALGVVLVYKGSRVFNFAQGEFGTVGAFVALLLQSHVPLIVAVIGGIAGGALMGLATERLVVQPLFDAPKVTLLVATAAVALGAIALQLAIGDAEIRRLRPLISGDAFVIANVPVLWQQLLIILALIGLAVVLWLFFTRTDLGLAVLAASQEPTATNLVGISVRRISALVWGMAALLGAVAGVLVAPVAQLSPGFGTSSLLIFGFVAAVVGGMTSLPGAVLGGILVGMVQAFTALYVQDISWVSDQITSPELVALFVVLVGVLAVRPAGLLGKEA
ncbi:MAG: branched-chain amino acid ABC transporter permease [Actinomycetota bacterium]